MSLIEGIGDDFLFVFGFLIFIGIITLAWFSTRVNHIHFPATLFIIERRTRRRNEEEESERTSPTPPSSRLTPAHEQSVSLSSGNETQTEHESDNESSEIDEFNSDQIPIVPELKQQSSNTNPIETNNHQQTTSDERENQSLKIIIKFLNDTRKEISANPNDTISTIKQLHFANELATNKMIRFIYQGRELQDRETLRTYNIRDETIIHCQISIRRDDSTNQRPDGTSSGTHRNTNRFDASPLIESPPINISSYFVILLSLILVLIWYLRINYRVLFTPISTIFLILITIIFAIFTCGSLLTTRQRVSNTSQTTIAITPIQHVHLD
ncbi:unnamed protein product [Adineta steineri]|uniref:Ubiquitin-like domain-containing protein n=1 Tax=Adineta steineri TaxID=433720 RepID=A0A813QQI2_9BILA|nr:unnamed protein product [Adineta steineri]CAF1471311.1 unnamed protein product [Adineta steineri]